MAKEIQKLILEELRAQTALLTSTYTVESIVERSQTSQNIKRALELRRERIEKHTGVISANDETTKEDFRKFILNSIFELESMPESYVDYIDIFCSENGNDDK
jgi:hypothetical protein